MFPRFVATMYMCRIPSKVVEVPHMGSLPCLSYHHTHVLFEHIAYRMGFFSI